MGAIQFGQVEIAKTAKDAYSRAVEEAEYESGHDPYNGTISTTEGFRMTTGNPRFGTKAFAKWEEENVDNYGKWEGCGCIEITGAVAKRIKEKRGLKGRRGLKVFYFFGWAAY